MKILLVYPNGKISCDGFRMISALLRRDGHQLQIVTLPKLYPIEATEHELQLLGEFSIECDMVMMGVYSVNEYLAKQITQYLKYIRPERLVIWGGPHCIGTPEKSLQYADGVCYSEGDIAVPRFVQLYEAGDPTYLQTHSMAFRVSGSFQINPLMPLIEDLDSLPFYDYSFENEWLLNETLIPVTPEIYAKYCASYPFGDSSISILTSRGCPHKCTYCANIRYLKMYSQMKIRRNSVEHSIAELENMIQHLPNINNVSFTDDDFFLRPEREILKFVSLYKKRINFPYSIYLSANSFTEGKISLLMKLGSAFIQMGVQTGSQRILDDVYKRSISLKKVKDVFKSCKPYLENDKLTLLVQFIIDNPYETKLDVLKTYRFLVHLHKNIFVNLYALSLVPGTELYKRALHDNHISSTDILASRDYKSRDIKYQVNYPMLLILIWEQLHQFQIARKLPVWLMLLPACAPFRLLMLCVPRPLMRWALIKIPKCTKRMAEGFISKNKNSRERMQAGPLKLTDDYIAYIRSRFL